MTRPVAAAIGAAGASLTLPADGPGTAAWLILGALLLVGAAVRMVARRRELLVAALAAGAVAARLAAAPGASAVPASLPAGSGPWPAVVETLAAPRDGQQVATLQLDGSGLRVAATLPRYPEVEPRHRVVVDGVLEPAPDGPYGDYLRRTGVAATLRARTLDHVGSAGPAAALESLRRGAAAALAAAVPEPEAGLAAGILVGLRDRVDRDLAADFTTVGASHVVAISGWNIAIVAASVAALGGRLGRRRRSVLTIAVIVAYVIFVGASASVLRAAAMAGVVLLARESGRAGHATAALGWAATGLLLAEPALIRDAGFQLSTLATAGLIAWATPLSRRLERVGGGHLPGWLVDGLGVSLAAQAATLPIVLASFGRLSLVSPAVNLVVVPLVAPAMAAGAIALAAGAATVVLGAPSLVATLAGLPAWALLAVVVTVVRLSAGLPFASVTVEPPGGVVIGVVMAAILLVVGTARGRRWLARAGTGRSHPSPTAPSGPLAARAAAGGAARSGRLARVAAVALAGSVAVAALAIVHRPDGRTRIVVLDVGQGDAILVEGGRGGRILVDGGPDPDALLVALDERLPPWDRRLDALVLTHPHEDHVAGLALLLERYRVGRVVEPGMRGSGPGYRAWAAGLTSLGVSSTRLATGDALRVDDARLRVLWPDPGSVDPEPADTGTGINNVSIVLLGEVDGRRFLLAGDIEEEIDPTLVARGLPEVDVLKVAHHGSGTATTDAFLDAVRPRIAVVSAGEGNRFGHPARGTLDRLAARNSRVLRTDRDGAVEITLERDGLEVRTSGSRAAGRGGTARLASAAWPGGAGRAVAALAGGATRTAALTTSEAALVRPILCGIPAGGGPSSPDPADVDVGPEPGSGVGAIAGTTAERSAEPTAARARPALVGGVAGLLYHRGDVRPRARGRRPPAPDPRSADLVPPPLTGRRRGRRLARGQDCRSRDRGRSPPRRHRRAPARRRQAAPRR